jgi:SAM-dependent MidA family methyltransferase
MPFETYMEQCLYHPDHGFYSQNIPRLGRTGHFFTSVQAGSVFGYALARQGRCVWEALGRPAPFWFCEQGAHDGRLARDILEAVARDPDPDWRAAVHYRIIEPSPLYRTAQAQTLSDSPLKAALFHSPDWASLPPASMQGILLCNELLDAFPVHLVEFRNGTWHQVHITADQGQLKDALLEITKGNPLLDMIQALPLPPIEGYRTEINARAKPWIQQVSTRIKDGLILVVDYGFDEATLYRPDRSSGTLQTYQNHKSNPDYLELPGEKDLTAHVNFTEVARNGLACGCHLLGWSDQHHWLVDLMQADLLAWEQNPALAPSPRWIAQFQTLMHPASLGTTFHALALGCGRLCSTPLRGFEHSRHRYLQQSSSS